MPSFDLYKRIVAAPLPPGEKLLLLVVCTYTDQDGANAFPSVDTLAKGCGCTAREIQRRLNRLRAVGYLEVQAATAQHRPTTYRVVVPAAGNMVLSGVTLRSSLGQPAGVTGGSLRGDRRVGPGATGGSPDQYRDQFKIKNKPTGAARRLVPSSTLRAPGILESDDWFEECKRAHAGACGGNRSGHHWRMKMDAVKAAK